MGRLHFPHTRWLFPLALLITALGGGCGDESPSFVVVDGRRVGFEVLGNGDATVVFENGHGSERDVWSLVFGDVAQFAKSFRYDRPGYGASNSTTLPRSALRIVTELRDTLAAAGLAPPYVLVGHSLGGMYMEYYAKTFPQEVAALVLVDSRPADFTDRCIAGFDADRCSAPEEIIAMMPPHQQAEIRMISIVETEIMDAPPLRPMPFFVLTAGEPDDPAAADVHALWLEVQEDLASQLDTSVHSVVLGSGHFIQLQSPATVVGAIRGAVDAAAE